MVGGRGAVLVLFLLALVSGCSGSSSQSGPPSQNPDGGTLPATPTGVTARSGDGQATISWSAAGGASTYNVYYGTASGVSSSSPTRLTGITGTSGTVTGLTNGTTYYFVVTGVNGTGQSEPSAQVKLIVISPSATAFIPNDPLFGDQWHLRNTGQAGASGVPGLVGQDLNVTPAWVHGQGSGVRIAIVDDGMDGTHPDLLENVAAGLSYDYTDGGTSLSSGNHGTACAGLAAAVGNNGLGVTGVAMGSSLVGYNILANLNSANEVDAMTRGLEVNGVYSNSWGATDGTGALTASSETWRAAVDNGVDAGRGGRGVVYTWAAGNGSPTDRSDYDGQATYHAVIAVAALTDQGTKSSYSEEGSNLLVSAYGGEFCDTHMITTVDVQGVPGYNNGGDAGTDYPGQPDYTRCFNGTSAATPEVSGAAALVIEANPSLSWRAVRWLLATTARRTDPTDPDWTNNGAGYPVNHKYGFGVVNVAAATAAARAWDGGVPLVGPQRTFTVSGTPQLAIPDNSPNFVTTTLAVNASGLSGVEFVDVTITSDHPQFGELGLALVSPSNTVSLLAVPHSCVANEAAVPCGPMLASGNRFGVARLLGEPANGTWTLRVLDQGAGNSGTIQSWSITIYGY